uniref:Uncharacterized protein n=1 Tax=Cucumis melo TaxID=3656 RepID=A0A9I9E4B6_CUCME
MFLFMFSVCHKITVVKDPHHISLALDVYTERFCHAAKQTLFYELPQLVKQAKASEKQTSGELFLGHAHEHDL